MQRGGTPQIQVYEKETQDGIVLTYQLMPFDRIEDILIIGVPEGEFKETLSQVLRLKPDGAYIPKIVKSDIDRIKNVCRDYGYFDAGVVVSDIPVEAQTQQAEKYHSPSVRLIYQVALGDASSIKELQIRGNSAIPTHRLKAACNFSQQPPIYYNKSTVDTAVASMLMLYQERSLSHSQYRADFFP